MPRRLLDAEYWVANVRQPARLSQAITAAAQDHTTFIEISAHPILTHAVNDTLESVTHHHSVGTLWRDGDDTVELPHQPQHHPHEPSTADPASTANRIRCCPPLRGTTPGTGSMSHRCRRRGESVEPEARLVDAYRRGDSAGVVLHSWPGRPANCPVRRPTQDSVWLVLADSGLGAEIGRVLGDDSRVTVLPPSVLADDTDSAALADALAGVTHVLYAPQVSSGCFDAGSGYDLFDSARRLTAAVAAMAAIALPPRAVSADSQCSAHR